MGVHPDFWAIAIREAIHIACFPGDWVKTLFVGKDKKRELNYSILSPSDSQHHSKPFISAVYFYILHIITAGKTKRSAIVKIGYEMSLVGVAQLIFITFTSQR